MATPTPAARHGRAAIGTPPPAASSSHAFVSHARRARDMPMPMHGASRRKAAILVAALLAPAIQAQAHPHVFIDAGVDFLFDDEGRLSHLRVTWLYDHLWTLILLEDLGIAEAPDGTIAPEDANAVARDQSQWIDGYEGDATLLHDGRAVGLSRPIEPQADYREGQVEIRFLRALEAPIRPEAGTVVKLYDPTYFVAYFVAYEPGLEFAPEGCTAEVVPFEPTGPLVALQQSLFDIPPDEDPEEPVGHLFADRVYVSCQ
jgi:ABC-type uncharacterized transport system substrate-binding protein